MTLIIISYTTYMSFRIVFGSDGLTGNSTLTCSKSRNVSTLPARKVWLEKSSYLKLIGLKTVAIPDNQNEHPMADLMVDSAKSTGIWLVPTVVDTHRLVFGNDDTRDVFLQRLEKDLIGPFDGLYEALFSKPSDHYLTGILYPKETRIPDSEQEDDDEVFGGKDTGEEGVEQGVSNFRRFRPCTAGISFAIPQTSSKSKICVTIRYGQYAPEATFIPFDPDRPDNPKPDKPLYWQRAQIEEIIEINLLSETQRIQLSGEGSEHLELFVR